jgi:hypothetical protein
MTEGECMGCSIVVNFGVSFTGDPMVTGDRVSSLENVGDMTVLLAGVETEAVH